MTFSITARCEKTGQFGIAVTTKLPAVGSLCPFLEAGVGAVASQAFVNPYIGINGLKYLKEGYSAEEVKEKFLKDDPGIGLRQFVIIDKEGNIAIHSGDKCDGWYGHIFGKDYGVAGNMLVGEDTIIKTAKAYEENQDMPFAERLLTALQAGQDAGGDKRGRQSAALKIVHVEDYPLIDLRVDEHEDPVKELRRVYDVAKKELFPLLKMLPTRANQEGAFDFEETRKMGVLQDK